MKLKIVFSLLIISGSLSAQNESIKTIELLTTNTGIREVQRITLTPKLAIRTNNHEFAIGPTFLVATKNTVAEKKVKFTGFQVSYKSYPLVSDKKINFYFFNDLMIQRIVEHWTSNIWSGADQSYVPYRYKNAEYLLQEFVGYGFDLDLIGHFVLHNSVGGGIYYSVTKGESLTADAPTLPYLNDNINGYSPFGFNWQIKIGLAYRL